MSPERFSLREEHDVIAVSTQQLLLIFYVIN